MRRERVRWAVEGVCVVFMREGERMGGENEKYGCVPSVAGEGKEKVFFLTSLTHKK